MKEGVLQTQSKINWLVAIGLGLFLGVLSAFSPGALFSFSLALLIVFLINLLRDKEEKLFLTRVFIWGVSIRFFLLLLVQYFFMSQNKRLSLDGVNKCVTFFGDDGMHTIVGWWYAQYASGANLSDYPLMVVLTGALGDYGRSGYLYLVSLFYFIFGFSPISVTFINSIIGVLTGLIYYFIAREISGRKSAKITIILVTSFPSLIVWSIVNLKDSLFIFLTGNILWLFLLFLNKNKVRYLIMLAPLAMLQYTLRPWILLPTLFIFSLCYLLIKKRIKMAQIFLLTVILVIGSLIFKESLNEIKGKIINYHLGIVASGGFTYHIYDNWVYSGNIQTASVPCLEVIKGFFKGWLHFFFEPFPWKISSKLSLVSMPQMLIWYFLIPFSIVGILMQLRRNWKKSLVLVVYFVVIGSILSVTGGNIGTDFRIRDVLTPIVLLFSSIGLIRLLSSVD